MKAKTEVQLLALKLEDEATFDIHHEAKACMTNAAAELRRLEAANAELLESLVEVLDYADCERSSPFWDHFDRVSNKARAAIKKHGGAA